MREIKESVHQFIFKIQFFRKKLYLPVMRVLADKYLIYCLKLSDPENLFFLEISKMEKIKKMKKYEGLKIYRFYEENEFTKKQLTLWQRLNFFRYIYFGNSELFKRDFAHSLQGMLRADVSSLHLKCSTFFSILTVLKFGLQEFLLP